MTARVPDPEPTSPRRTTARVEERGLPMRVLALEPDGGSLACCAGTDAIATTVETALVAPVQPGDVLLVHDGVALARLDAEWAP